MGDVITRKCAHCKGEIVIDVDDIGDVCYFDKLYYHLSCFDELVTKKASSARCSAKWKTLLIMGFRQSQIDAKNTINYCYGHDKLFGHILNHYDVYAISSYSKMLMENVVKGEYKGKSRPIPYRDFADCWIDIQDELDSIFKRNQHIGKQMNSDQRINYDLAVVVRAYPEWKKKQEYKKQKEEHRKITAQQDVGIDYTQVKTYSAKDGLGDINDLLDEI